MMWGVTFTRKAKKQAGKLLPKEQDALKRLLTDLRVHGPVLPNWHNYSKLGRNLYHCHLSYKWVVCWQVEDNELKLIEITYAGSRENAPY